MPEKLSPRTPIVHGPRDESTNSVAICCLLMKSIFLGSLSLPLFILIASSSCAEGKGDPEGTDRMVAGAGGASAGAGGASAGTGGSLQGGSSTGGAGSPSGGFAGALTTCDPLDPTACSHKCTVVGDGFFCDPEGNVAEGQACGADKMGDNCGPGTLCVQGICARFCTTSTDCMADQSCSLELDGPSKGDTFKVCQAKVYECKPDTQAGCSAEKACYPQTSGYRCSVPGTTAVGSPCSFANDCVKGASCFKLNSTQTCFKLCDLSANSGCDAGQKCTKQGDDYGICTGSLFTPFSCVV